MIPKANTMHTIDSADKTTFRVLQLVRGSIAVGMIVFIQNVIDLGTPTFVLALAALGGTFFAGGLLQKGWGFWKTVLLHLLIVLFLWLCFSLVDFLFRTGASSNPNQDFLVYRYWEHFRLILFVYAFCFLSTWLFWCNRQALTWEVTFGAIAFVWVLSGHRNYNLDSPKSLNELAWTLGLAPQHLLLGLAVAFTLLLSFYLVLSNTRPLLRTTVPLKTYGPKRKILAFFSPLVVLLCLIGFASYINRTYAQELNRATNGVGQETREGQSPLGFHSAIGKTKQPAALVRLEGDYTDNPWSPMLYLREGALSEFNGRELVIANPKYDTDVPRITVGQPFFSLEEDTPDPFRKELTYSVFLLTKHSEPFAIDYPKSIRLIQNPDPNRFVLAYQALSQVPVIKLETLLGEEVGKPSWDKETRDHYLRAPGSLTTELPSDVSFSSSSPLMDAHGEDLRYFALAKSLNTNFDSPLLRASAIATYLSQNSLYTRNPGHQVTEKGDPVAPYLFSEEKRGYCVHFAHAAVYLMRLAGIPARIATGYLTDLTYAKDGHILLHMGDRHAWPEVFVNGYGWVVVDVTPIHAENEQSLIPDEKLLEELMSKLDPAQELLTPPKPLETDAPKTNSILEELFNRRVLLVLLSSLVIAWILLKTWFRFGYRFVRDEKRKVRLAYTAFATGMADLGFFRNPGETRQEFASRLYQSHTISGTKITDIHERNTYSTRSLGLNTADLSSALRECLASHRKHTHLRIKRYLAFLSPMSIAKFKRL